MIMLKKYGISALVLICSLLSNNIDSSLANDEGIGNVSTSRVLRQSNASKATKKSKKQCKRNKKTKKPEQCKDLDQEPFYIPLPHFNLPEDPKDMENAVAKCAGTLMASGFDRLDTANYGLWFTEDSTMRLALAGVYKGLNNIKEYVNYVYDPQLFTDTQFVKGPMDLDPALGIPALIPIIANGDRCVLTSVGEYSSASGPIIEPPISADHVSGYRLDFTMTGEGSGITMNHIELFYSRPFIEFNFAEALLSKEVATRNCEILLSEKCQATAEYNCIKDVESCVREMLSLPALDSTGSFTGKSMGCRTLHASFAATNDAHCPHLSFAPQYDPNCEIKCQEATSIDFEDVFLPEELAYFSAFSAVVGLGSKMFVSPSRHL